jgi:hypothetical protein
VRLDQGDMKAIMAIRSEWYNVTQEDLLELRRLFLLREASYASWLEVKLMYAQRQKVEVQYQLARVAEECANLRANNSALAAQVVAERGER